MDALKCTMEGHMFYCHYSEPDALGRMTDPCIGYLVSRASMHDKTPLEAPWKFSHEDTEKNRITDTPHYRAEITGHSVQFFSRNPKTTTVRWHSRFEGKPEEVARRHANQQRELRI